MNSLGVFDVNHGGLGALKHFYDHMIATKRDNVINGDRELNLNEIIELFSEVMATTKFKDNKLFADSTKKECIRVLTKIIIEGKILNEDGEWI